MKVSDLAKKSISKELPKLYKDSKNKRPRGKLNTPRPKSSKSSYCT